MRPTEIDAGLAERTREACDDIANAMLTFDNPAHGCEAADEQAQADLAELLYTAAMGAMATARRNIGVSAFDAFMMNVEQALRDRSEAGDGQTIEPKVGMGATIGIGSDCYAATVTKVTRCTVTVEYDGVMSGSKPMTFRVVRGAWRNGPHYLSLRGRRDYRAPEF